MANDANTPSLDPSELPRHYQIYAYSDPQVEGGDGLFHPVKWDPATGGLVVQADLSGVTVTLGEIKILGVDGVTVADVLDNGDGPNSLVVSEVEINGTPVSVTDTDTSVVAAIAGAGSSTYKVISFSGSCLTQNFNLSVSSNGVILWANDFSAGTVGGLSGLDAKGFVSSAGDDLTVTVTPVASALCNANLLYYVPGISGGNPN